MNAGSARLTGSPAAAAAAAAAEVQEALSLLDFYGEFPVDCRLVAQAVHHASLLGRVQRETARAAPLCVLVDLAALVRRPGALAACLRWLLGLPTLRAVQFAEGGKGSMLDEEELGLLLHLVAVRPEAAAGLRHLGTCTRLLGRQFDAGALNSVVPASMSACCGSGAPQLPSCCYLPIAAAQTSCVQLQQLSSVPPHLTWRMQACSPPSPACTRWS